MDSEVDIAICLRQWDFSETSQTAVLLCRRLGVLRVLGKGTKRADPRFSGGLEIGTLGEAVIVRKANSGLATLAGWDLRETYRSARTDLNGYYAAMFALEVTLNLIPEGEPHPASFDALAQVLGRDRATSWQHSTVAFLWKILTDAGFRPNVDDEVQGQAVFIPSLGILSGAGGHPPTTLAWAMLESTASSLVHLAHDGSTDSLEFEAAERVGRFLAWYVRELIERELSTLRPLFGDREPKPLFPQH